MQCEHHEFHSKFVVFTYYLSSLVYFDFTIFKSVLRKPKQSQDILFFHDKPGSHWGGGAGEAAAEFQCILSKIFSLENKLAKTEEPLALEKSLFL